MVSDVAFAIAIFSERASLLSGASPGLFRVSKAAAVLRNKAIEKTAIEERMKRAIGASFWYRSQHFYGEAS